MVTTDDFLNFSEDEQMNVVAFLLTMEKMTENDIEDRCIVEESIRKELHKLVNNN